MARRNLTEINAGSMADIAFLLLIFFLVSTTMETDKGIMRILPPFDGVITTTPVKDRNILTVLINRQNKLLVEGEELELRELRMKAREFIRNNENKPSLPVRSTVSFPYFGDIMVTPGHVISLRNDRGTSYEMYLAVQNELVAAYNELREETARNKWGCAYSNLPDDKQKVIASIFPMKISEAEPN
jgi:biopolymer transport protein ExbD